MGVKIEFTSGKTRTFKNATWFRENNSEWFKGKEGRSFTAPAYVIGGFPSGKTVHYQRSKVRSIYYS